MQEGSCGRLPFSLAVRPLGNLWGSPSLGTGMAFTARGSGRGATWCPLLLSQLPESPWQEKWLLAAGAALLLTEEAWLKTRPHLWLLKEVACSKRMPLLCKTPSGAPQPMMSLPLEEPPDGGWGWLVVLAGFLANWLTYGILRSLGVLFEDLVEAFDASTAQISWVTAITLATQQFASPLGTAASTRYGARPVVMLGALLSSLGIFGASFSSSLLQLYLALGVLTGLGWALAFAPAMGTLSRYFSSRRSLAVGLALTGNGLASFAFSPLLRLLADSLAWRGALMTTSALALHLLVCGALLRPLALRGERPPSSFTFDWGLLAQRGFGAFALGIALLAAGYFTPYVHLDPYGRALGLGPYRAASVVSLAALADALARLLAGFLADRRLLPPVYLLLAFNSLVGCSLLAFPLATSFAGTLALALLYGTSAGGFATVVFGVLPELVGVARVVNATGLCLMAMSIGGLLGPPLSGFLQDQTGDFTASFLVGGAFILCASLVFLALLPAFASRCGARLEEKPRGARAPLPSLPMAPLAQKLSPSLPVPLDYSDHHSGPA